MNAKDVRRLSMILCGRLNTSMEFFFGLPLEELVLYMEEVAELGDQ